MLAVKGVISLAAPALIGHEREYVLDCIDTNELSWNGKYLQKFEEKFASYLKVKHAVAVSSGTTALHLACLAAGLKSHHRILVPTLTYVATANAVRYCGAEVVFGDVSPTTWGLDCSVSYKERTDGVIPVHLYGVPCGIAGIVEDAAQALGGSCGGHPIGSMSPMSIFSFYANKIITTGEGGMIVTDDDGLAEQLRFLRGQAQSKERRYWHTEIGYNYRMTNLQAALGLGQLEMIDELLARRNLIVSRYHELLSDTGITWQKTLPGTVAAPWMFTCLLPLKFNRDTVVAELKDAQIETRPTFPCVHQMPMYNVDDSFPVAEDISQRGISLPTHALLTLDDVETVCTTLRDILDG